MYCLDCHGSEKPKGGLDLSGVTSATQAGKDFRLWETIVGQLRVGAMPTEKAKKHPSAAERDVVLKWIRDVRVAESKRTAGDPGPVPARRLSLAEYDHTIRDLTGVDLKPTKDFPVDPANEAGFDNSAESLTTSPQLIEKYLKAARHVADHLILTPEGFTFAEFPAIAETDRDKYAVRKVIEFYKRQKTDLADYFEAAWHSRFHPTLSLESVAKERGLSVPFAMTIAEYLKNTDTVGPNAAVRALWESFPPPNADLAVIRRDCERLRDAVVGLRMALTPVVPNINSQCRGMAAGSQPISLWKNDEQARNRMRYSGGALSLKRNPFTDNNPIRKVLTPPTDAGAAVAYEATFARFCETFPDQFVVTERARTYLDPAKEKGNAGRLLNAGFHSMTGYYRDDAPLYKLILDDAGRAELDRLWREFDFVTNAPVRQYTSFIWYEHAESGFMRVPEFDSFRAEDKDVTTEPRVGALRDLFLATVKRREGSAIVQSAVTDYFRTMNETLRRLDASRVAAEPRHVNALKDFAERAYRRPVTESERRGVVTFYRTLRDSDGLTHEDAVRDSVVRILMSPHFGFRTTSTVPNANVTPLSDIDIASRLSYFLWASLPDETLMKAATAGELNTPDGLVNQARRMLRDGKARGLATEFAGNWLDVRRFEEHNAVDRERFPQFDTALHSAMFEEPIRFFEDVARNDRPVLDFVYGSHTFVNKPLAKHYGLPEPKGDDWVRIDATGVGRGGLLPMAVFLTKNAPGLRTSPVKRGYWVVRRLLGETVPAPPAEVPELPADESKIERPLRDVLAMHRAHPSCCALPRPLRRRRPRLRRFRAGGRAPHQGFGRKAHRRKSPVPRRRRRHRCGWVKNVHPHAPAGRIRR